MIKKRNSEAGVALVTVLVMLASVSLLVMSMTAYSQLAVYGIRNDADMLRSRYVAEGAMNRVIWLLAADNYVYNTNDLATFDYSEYDEERFLPDGRLRKLDYYGTPVKYRIENGMGGFSIDSGVASVIRNLTKNRSSEDEDLSEAVTIFQTRYTDYTDANDTVGVDGMEHDDYEALEEEIQLPRDAALQYREELWYIPDGIKFFPPDRNGRLSWINPLGMSRARNQRPDLLQANYAMLTNYSNLSHEDALETLRIIKTFQRNPVPEVLNEEFEPLLLTTLKRFYTINNSKCYRITIESASKETSSSVRMDATYFDPGIESESGFIIDFWDWLVY